MLTFSQAFCLSLLPATGPEVRDKLIELGMVKPGNHFAFVDRLVEKGWIKKTKVTNGVTINQLRLTKEGERQLKHAKELCRLILR